MRGVQEVDVDGAVIHGYEKVGVDQRKLPDKPRAHFQNRPGAFGGFIYADGAEAYAILPYFSPGGAKVVRADSREMPLRAEFMYRLHKLTGMHITAELTRHEEDMFFRIRHAFRAEYYYITVL